jgi:hypothetical protein
MLTEGGARLSAVGSRSNQADLVRDNFNLLLSDDGRLRAGMVFLRSTSLIATFVSTADSLFSSTRSR